MKLKIKMVYGDIRDVLLALHKQLEPDYRISWALSKDEKSASIHLEKGVEK